MTHPESQPVLRVQGRGLVESPRWHDGRWWFADWTAGAIMTLDADNTVATVVQAPAPPLCFDFLPDGRLLFVSSRDGKLVRLAQDGSLETYADLAHLSNGLWNEIVVDGRGNTYVNGGCLALVTADGKAQSMAGGFAFPNGMAITPDNRTLILAESHGRCLTAFDIADNGALSGRRLWADLGEGTPDGICVDAQGCVWYADVPHRCCVRVHEGGAIEQRIDLDRGAFACMLGGTDRRTLLITAARWFGMDRMAEMAGTGQLLTASVDVRGVGWP